MLRYRVEYVVRGSTTISVDEDEEITLGELFSQAETDGLPVWLEKFIRAGLKFETVEVEDIRLTNGGELEAEEELDFDMDA